jgi:hypothetical protein
MLTFLILVGFVIVSVGSGYVIALRIRCYDETLPNIFGSPLLALSTLLLVPLLSHVVSNLSWSLPDFTGYAICFIAALLSLYGIALACFKKWLSPKAFILVICKKQE